MSSLLDGHDLQTILNMDDQDSNEEEDDIEQIDVMGTIVQRGQAFSSANTNNNN